MVIRARKVHDFMIYGQRLPLSTSIDEHAPEYREHPCFEIRSLSKLVKAANRPELYILNEILSVRQVPRQMQSEAVELILERQRQLFEKPPFPFFRYLATYTYVCDCPHRSLSSSLSALKQQVHEGAAIGDLNSALSFFLRPGLG